MGKRRIRCLQSLGYFDIIGFDVRSDRRAESQGRYNIKTLEDLSENVFEDIDVVIVSTPPDKHARCAKSAIEKRKPVFVEASVVLDDVEDLLRQVSTHNVYVAPSCTLRFHPLIQDISAIIKSKKYGEVTNFSYHSGQFLPDWHPWEDIKDFYVSNKTTGGAREIVPFELTWLVDAFGFPDQVCGMQAKTVDLGVDIDDSYVFILSCKNMLGSVTVDVVSRYATRSLLVNIEKAQIRWNWEDAFFTIYEAEGRRSIRYEQPPMLAENGYNENIGEKMYIDELYSFIQGIDDRRKYPHSLEDDIRVLNILKKIEDGGK
jgi:predicted dehydrogenase